MTFIGLDVNKKPHVLAAIRREGAQVALCRAGGANKPHAKLRLFIEGLEGLFCFRSSYILIVVLI